MDVDGEQSQSNGHDAAPFSNGTTPANPADGVVFTEETHPQLGDSEQPNAKNPLGETLEVENKDEMDDSKTKEEIKTGIMSKNGSARVEIEPHIGSSQFDEAASLGAPKEENKEEGKAKKTESRKRNVEHNGEVAHDSEEPDSTQEMPCTSQAVEPTAKRFKNEEEFGNGTAGNGFVDEENEEEQIMDEEEEEGPEDEEDTNNKVKTQRKRKKGGKRGPRTERTVKYQPCKIYKECESWMTRSCVNSVRIDDEESISDAGKAALAKIEDSLREKNCTTVELNINATVPGTGDFRGLNKAIQTHLFTVKPMPEEPEEVKDQPFHPTMYFTGPNYIEATSVDGRLVVELAKRYKVDGINRIYGPIITEKVDRLFMEEEKTAAKRDQQFFEENCSEEEKEKVRQAVKNGYLPVARYHVPSNSVDVQEKMRNIMHHSSLTVFKNIPKAFGMDLEPLKAERVGEVRREATVHLRRQMPQSTTTNFNYTGQKQQARQWHALNLAENEAKMEEFMAHKSQVEEFSRDARQKIAREPEKVEDHLRKLADDLRTITMKYGEKWNPKRDAKTFILPFCTNVNITEEYVDVTAQVNRLPECMIPNMDLMPYSQEMIPGINQAQEYLKIPGVRTPGHFENGNAASLNLSIGPATCIWFGIPFEYHGALLELMDKRKVGSRVRGPTKKCGVWPNEEDLIEHGIPFHKIEQKPGDMVHVGYGTYHWVQANGFADNIAWNIMPQTFNQLAVSAIFHDHNVVTQHTSEVPLESMLWQMALQQAEMEGDFKKLVKTMLMRSLAKTQFELDFIESKKWAIKVPTGNDIEPVERCSTSFGEGAEKRCRTTLFNFVPMVNGEPLCFHCARKIKQSPRSGMIVYQRHTMDALIKAFDSITFQHQ